ncbi:MAG: DUF4197 domain-containing protein [Flavisolibacter sp.]|nr:DUF4197 domain-containing protein [Flavisolibacter sp.]
MKRIFTPLLFVMLLPATFSCSTLRNYTLTEADAAAAIRQLLQLGAQDNLLAGSFSKDAIMAAVFPESLRKTLNTLNQLGLTGEIDRFTVTLGTAAEQTATRSIPIFVNSISGMQLQDAMRIVKSGGTSATEYLRSAAGANLRTAITPVMKEALNEYKLNEQWENNIAKPIQSLTGNRLNLQLDVIMAGLVSEAMFRKMEEREREIRANAAARTTPLLQKVFSRNWN